jgi:carboxymethylenebutenolidase
VQYTNRSQGIGYTDLAAAVPFYARQGDLDKVAAIKAPLLLHYTSEDERVNAGSKAYDAALKAAAELAWGRALEFFKQYLS